MQSEIYEHPLIPEFSEIDAIITRAGNVVENNSSSSISADSMAQWAMSFNLTAHIIRSMTPDNNVPQFDCPPDYLYYGGSDSLNDGVDLGVGQDDTDLSAVDGSNVDDDIRWYDGLRYVVDVYAVSVLCAFGFIGNMLSIIVLRRDRLTGRRDVQNACTSCLLQALAALNTVHLAACLIIQPAKTVVGKTGAKASTMYMMMIQSAAATGNKHLIVLFDRVKLIASCVCVCVCVRVWSNFVIRNGMCIIFFLLRRISSVLA